MSKNPTIEELLCIIKDLQDTVKRLEKENVALKQELSYYKVKKHSNNSSIPPSKDENRSSKNKSLRKKSNKKAGGQKGHKGHTLQMSDSPDIVERHIPFYCGKCGNDLHGYSEELSSKRQIIDIPPIVPQITEHQVFQKQCNCGHITTGTFPYGVEKPVSYGSNVESLISYFNTRQFIPFLRMKEIFNDIFGLKISEGGIHYLLDRFTEKASFLYNVILQRIKQSPSVGTDETGGKVNGEKCWFWTWQTPELTFIAVSDNRGKATIDHYFENGLPNSILTHDCWRAHFNTQAYNHQVCLAHLLRDLNYLEDLYQNKWTCNFRELLLSAIELKRQMTKDDYVADNFNKRDIIIDKADTLLQAQEFDENHKKLITFYKRMQKYKDYLFVFLYHQQVPPDNNASERAIRNIKVKQKISGQFKSKNGAKRFAIIRSVTDTVIKNGRNILDALNLIAKFNFQTGI